MDIGYEGTIVPDTTRLEQSVFRKNWPKHSDWDEIGESLTAVRGVGYVAWYPVAMESADLSEGDSVAETVGRWKARHARSTMSVTFACTAEAKMFFSGTPSLPTMTNPDPTDNAKYSAFALARFGIDVPTFVLANYQELSIEHAGAIEYLSGSEDAAKIYSDLMAKPNPIVPVGKSYRDLQVLQLPDANGRRLSRRECCLLP